MFWNTSEEDLVVEMSESRVMFKESCSNGERLEYLDDTMEPKASGAGQDQSLAIACHTQSAKVRRSEV